MMNTSAFKPPQSVDEVIYRIQAAPVGKCSFKLPGKRLRVYTL